MLVIQKKKKKKHTASYTGFISQSLLQVEKFQRINGGESQEMWFMNSRVFVVVTGPDRFPQRMETVDRIFMIPPLFTPHSPSHTKQRSAFPCLCCLCFSSFFASLVFFDFCLSYHFFLCFLAREICLSQMQKARWFKALSHFKPKDCLTSRSLDCL